MGQDLSDIKAVHIIGRLLIFEVDFELENAASNVEIHPVRVTRAQVSGPSLLSPDLT